MIEPEYEPALVEAAVLQSLQGRPDGRALHEARDPLYALADTDAREAAFARLHARWFERLGLDRPLSQALAERREIGARCGRAIVAQAPAARAEGADLLMAPPALPVLLLRITPRTLGFRERALELLRRELLHVADMLDPGFGYEPRMDAEGPALAPGWQERYRILWSTSVEGRLIRSGLAPPTGRGERLREFARAFPALGSRAAVAFARFFDGPRCTHAELLAAATGGPG
jgi:hypothetical protein